MYNARYLKNKSLELEALATAEELHIIGVSESWINTDNRDFLAECNLQSYLMFSCEKQNEIGGGVLFYMIASVNPTVLQTEKKDNVDVIFL